MRKLWWFVPVALLVVAPGCGKKPAKTPPPAPARGNVAWRTDPKAAFAESKRTGKPVMMDLWLTGCVNCEQLDKEVWSRADVAEVSKQFVPLKVNGQEHPEFSQKYTVSGYPTTLFLTAEGKLIGRMRGAPFPEDMIAAMREALKKAPAKN